MSEGARSTLRAAADLTNLVGACRPMYMEECGGREREVKSFPTPSASGHAPTPEKRRVRSSSSGTGAGAAVTPRRSWSVFHPDEMRERVPPAREARDGGASSSSPLPRRGGVRDRGTPVASSAASAASGVTSGGIIRDETPAM